MFKGTFISYRKGTELTLKKKIPGERKIQIKQLKLKHNKNIYVGKLNK